MAHALNDGLQQQIARLLPRTTLSRRQRRKQNHRRNR